MNRERSIIVIDNLVNIAKKHEKLLEFDEASAIYKDLGMDEELIRVREEQRNKVHTHTTVNHAVRTYYIVLSPIADAIHHRGVGTSPTTRSNIPHVTTLPPWAQGHAHPW